MLAAVIFDMDGVLIDSEPLHYDVDLQILAEINVPVDRHYLDQYVGMTNPDMWAKIISDFGLVTDLNALVRKQIELKIHMLESRNYQAIASVERLIADIHRHDIPVTVASSSPPEFIEAVLERLQLKDRIQYYVSGENVPNGKPAPDIFLAVAQKLGCRSKAWL